MKNKFLTFLSFLGWALYVVLLAGGITQVINHKHWAALVIWSFVCGAGAAVIMHADMTSSDDKPTLRRLVNNPFNWTLSEYILPGVGFIVNMCTFLTIMSRTWMIFHHYEIVCIYRELLKEDSINTDSWRGCQIVLWHEKGTISIHTKSGILKSRCVVSDFHMAKWDLEMNERIYQKINAQNVIQEVFAPTNY